MLFLALLALIGFSALLLGVCLVFVVYGLQRRERWIAATAALVAMPLALMWCVVCYFIVIAASWPEGW